MIEILPGGLGTRELHGTRMIASIEHLTEEQLIDVMLEEFLRREHRSKWVAGNAAWTKLTALKSKLSDEPLLSYSDQAFRVFGLAMLTSETVPRWQISLE